MPHEVEEELSKNPRIDALCQALVASCSDQGLLLRFLRDFLTFDEIMNIANRWAVARMLLDGKSQIETARTLGVSTKTVSAVSRWVSGPYSTYSGAEIIKLMQMNEHQVKTDG